MEVGGELHRNDHILCAITTVPAARMHHLVFEPGIFPLPRRTGPGAIHWLHSRRTGATSTLL